MIIFSIFQAAVTTKDYTGKTALHYCAENEDVEIAEMILDAGRKIIDHRDQEGYTTLHLATIAANEPIVKLLLERKAKINAKDNEGHTVAHWASGEIWKYSQ